MTDRPIIFSAPMIAALLAGRKTMTRRIFNPASTLFNGGPWPAWAKAERWDWDGAWVDPGPSPMGNPGPYLKLPHADKNDDVSDWGGTVHRLYPVIWLEDRLWVREAHAFVPSSAYRQSEGVDQACNPEDRDMAVICRAGFDRSSGGIRWRPSIHMPRWASRLTLTVADVRVQRLNEISEEDAIAEGIARGGAMGMWGWWDYGHDEKRLGRRFYGDPRESFRTLWESLHGAGSWAVNPWVSVITFETRRGNIDA